VWDCTEGALRAALERRGLDYHVNEGDGAFYGPKIDLHMRDSLGRPWQMGTVQLDSQQPERLGCRYFGADNAEHVPYVIHRALMGSFERFIGILTEHFAGAFPFWLAPVQIRVLPVGQSHREPAAALVSDLAPYRVEIDESDETVGKRIRNAEVEKIPYVVVYGDKESDESLAIREHGGAQETLSKAEFLAKLATLDPWQAGAEPFLTS
jgi:threonyl-tRNA synthetase